MIRLSSSLPSLIVVLGLLLSGFLLLPSAAQNTTLHGYYRFPTLHGNTVVFTAHGDLWRAELSGEEARPLTTHAGEESHPRISPDGRLVAFNADYEGPLET